MRATWEDGTRLGGYLPSEQITKINHHITGLYNITLDTDTVVLHVTSLLGTLARYLKSHRGTALRCGFVQFQKIIRKGSKIVSLKGARCEKGLCQGGKLNKELQYSPKIKHNKLLQLTKTG